MDHNQADVSDEALATAIRTDLCDFFRHLSRSNPSEHSKSGPIHELVYAASSSLVHWRVRYYKSTQAFGRTVTFLMDCGNDIQTKIV